MPPLLAVLIVSFILSVIIILVYKLMTDQVMMKSLKEDLKKKQKELKKYKDNPQKMMKEQKKVMELNMKYMTQSFKPTFVTFIPIILTFSWLNANFAFEPIHPGEEFNLTVEARDSMIQHINLTASNEITLISDSQQEFVDKKATWVLKGEKAKTTLNFFYDGGGFFNKDLIISDEQEYAPQVKKLSSPMKSVKIDMTKRKILNLGFVNLSWIWTYIIFSLIFSMSLRKIFKIY